MKVEYFKPAETDAELQMDDDGNFTLDPSFWTENGSAALGTLVCRNVKGEVVDRVVLSVNGKGTISLTHRKEKVTPVADQENTNVDA